MGEYYQDIDLKLCVTVLVGDDCDGGKELISIEDVQLKIGNTWVDTTCFMDKRLNLKEFLSFKFGYLLLKEALKLEEQY